MKNEIKMLLLKHSPITDYDKMAEIIEKFVHEKVSEMNDAIYETFGMKDWLEEGGWEDLEPEYANYINENFEDLLLD